MGGGATGPVAEGAAAVARGVLKDLRAAHVPQHRLVDPVATPVPSAHAHLPPSPPAHLLQATVQAQHVYKNPHAQDA